MDERNIGEFKRVWEYFQVIDSAHAKCTICPLDPVTNQAKIIKTKNGSTTGLHTHLKLHNIVAIKRSKRQVPQDSVPVPSKKRVEISFNALEDRSLDAILARLVSLDRLSFNQISQSNDIRAGIAARLREGGTPISVPIGQSTIRNHVMEYGNATKNILKMSLKLHREESLWFTVDCDEWTSVRRRRYLNINIFAKGAIYWNLGLVRIKGSASAECLVDLLRCRLNMFGVNLATDIVALTTDGAPVAKKMAKVAGVLGQLCLAHGLNLGVCDVLYKKPPTAVIQDKVQEDLTDDEDDNNDIFDIENPRETADYSANSTRDIVAKIRKLGVMFKQSVVNRERLQHYVKEKFPDSQTELQLLIDCKTRWSSMYLMLERFCKIADCVEKALIDVKSPVSISPFDKTVVAAIEKSLRPVMLMVKALCQRNSNLLQARAGLKVMLLTIWRQDNRFARLLVRKLRDRISERWDKSAGVLYYLQHGSYVDVLRNFSAISFTTEDDEDVNLFVDYEEDEVILSEREIVSIFSIPSKTEIKKFIVNLIQRMCAPEISPINDDVSLDAGHDPEVEETLKSFEDILNEEIRKADSSLPTSFPKETALSRIIANEMEVFEKNKSRGIFLEKAYNMLIAVKPTSVESERAFSSAGLVCTKIRSRLNDDTLDTLCFLRSFFSNPSANSVQLS